MGTKHHLLPTLSLLGAMILWASSFIAMKIAVSGFSPIAVVFGRMIIASLLFLVLWKNFRGLSVRRQDWKQLIFMALCEPCLYFVFEAYALKYTSATQAGMIVATLPVFVAIAAFFVLKEKLALRVWTGFFVAAFGVAMLSWGATATENAPDPLLGNTLETLAMVSATGYMITAKNLSNRYSPLFITALQAWVGAIFFLPLLAFTPGAFPTEFPTDASIAILYLASVVTMGAYGMYNYGLSKVPAGQASGFTNLIPVFTMLMGFAFLGDRLSITQFIASGLVLGGVILTQIAPAKKAKVTA
ncbi:DMT family transporter [Halodesulfovibrio spirochaetisodalis]|uniref:Membrane protein n=1 Tax=Halodesulfovibrio spirochaetisodalis TaxID=1560234 RepID=A0A1B7XD15_9BACT|nr:DMT family transporter [Halodesulfovibrio spirochaetisodalis]OBQ51857.1 membrane protein [Halodesulfovibrio spirochaetisodalis]